jgi:hypothetical protein
MKCSKRSFTASPLAPSRRLRPLNSIAVDGRAPALTWERAIPIRALPKSTAVTRWKRFRASRLGSNRRAAADRHSRCRTSALPGSPPDERSADVWAWPHLLPAMQSAQDASRKHGRLHRGEREHRHPPRHLPGLRPHDLPPGQSEEAGRPRRYGHTSAATHRRDCEAQREL